MLLGMASSLSIAQTSQAGAGGNGIGQTDHYEHDILGNRLPDDGRDAVYMIGLKYLTPDEAVAMLKDEKYQDVLPNGILGLAGVTGSHSLLVKVWDTESYAINSLSQILQVLDVPQTRAAITATLVYTPAPSGLPEEALTTEQFNLQLRAAILAHKASVVILPDALIRQGTNHVIINMPTYVPDSGTVIDLGVTTVPDTNELSFRVSILARGARITEKNDGKTAITCSSITGTTPAAHLKPGEVRRLLNKSDGQNGFYALYVSMRIVKDTPETADSILSPAPSPFGTPPPVLTEPQQNPSGEAASPPSPAPPQQH
jgi:hypothetical protein